MNELAVTQSQITGSAVLQGIVDSQKTIFGNNNMSDGTKLVAYGITVAFIFGLCCLEHHSRQSSNTSSQQ